MAKARRVLLALLLAALFGGGLFLGVILTRFGRGSGRQIYHTPELLKQVQTLSDLVTVQYVIEKVVVWNDPPTSVLGQFFAGDNRILLIAQGNVKAGVDLSQLKPDDLEVNGKTIIIRLPAPRVTDAYLDDKQTQVIERSTGFLRAFDKDLEQNVRASAVDDMRRAAVRGGILKDAQDRAQEQLAGLFVKLGGFERVEFRSPTSPMPNRISPQRREISESPKQ